MSAVFPLLKTGAVVQYPATKKNQYSSFVVRFIDGSDQRFRQFTPALLCWDIKLNLLDETEIHALEQFFKSQDGKFGTFAFVDPWTQSVYQNCSFDQDTLTYQFTDTSRGLAEYGGGRKPNVDALLSPTNIWSGGTIPRK